MSARFTLPLWPSLIVLLVMITMINLGLWQLRRFDEKNALLASYQQQLQQEPVPLSALNSEASPQFQRVRLQGHFQASPQWLLANQVQNKQLGFNVLSVFVQDDGQRVLVNRGFIAANLDPNALPDITLAELPLTISGHLFLPSAPWRSPPAGATQAGVNVLPVLDWQQLRAQLGAEHLYPLMLRLDADAPFGYHREWLIVAGNPEKHRAYAVQWFAMSLALIAVYGLYLTKRHKHKVNSHKVKSHEQHT